MGHRCTTPELAGKQREVWRGEVGWDGGVCTRHSQLHVVQGICHTCLVAQVRLAPRNASQSRFSCRWPTSSPAYGLVGACKAPGKPHRQMEAGHPWASISQGEPVCLPATAPGRSGLEGKQGRFVGLQIPNIVCLFVCFLEIHK